MGILPRKLRRRHATPAPAASVNLPSFAGPGRPDVMSSIAGRISELLGNRAELVGGAVHTYDDNGRFLLRLAADLAGNRWELSVPDGRRGACVDLPAWLADMEALGVETMARGLVAAIKRHERGRSIPPNEADIEAAYDRYADGWIGTGRDLRPAFPGEVQDPDDERSAREAWEAKFGEQPRPIRDARDLLISIGDHLAGLGLEPDLGGDTITFLFLGHVHRLELEDLERRTPGPSPDERAMMAAGMPVG